MFLCVFLLFVVSLVVGSSATDRLEGLISEITYYVSSGTLNSAHSLIWKCRFLLRVVYSIILLHTAPTQAQVHLH